jgi:hypothetical protein
MDNFWLGVEDFLESWREKKNFLKDIFIEQQLCNKNRKRRNSFVVETVMGARIEQPKILAKKVLWLYQMMRSFFIVSKNGDCS